MTGWILDGADVVLRDRIQCGARLIIGEGLIRSVEPPATVMADGPPRLDMTGWLILPGLIDLHSDALEKAVEPRPRVFFPADHAIRENDRLHLAGGITTLFNAVAIAGKEFGLRDPARACGLVGSLAGSESILRRRQHLRFEVSDRESLPLVEDLLCTGRVHLLSLMDHSPGQGQYRARGSFKRYLMRTYTLTDRQASALIRRKRQRSGPANDVIDRLVEAAGQAGVPVAAHDLDSPEAVARWRQRGVTLCEFPVNAETAEAARSAGMATLFGAPNLLRGSSSGTGMRALDAIESGVADLLCSDYAPASLLAALFRVAALGLCPLPQAVAMASAGPARVLGLSGLGEIAPGKVADLLVVRAEAERVHLEGVFVGGAPSLVQGRLLQRMMRARTRAER